jgi:hypothetical protein
MNFKEDGKESESLGKIVGSAFGKPQGEKTLDWEGGEDVTGRRKRGVE